MSMNPQDVSLNLLKDYIQKGDWEKAAEILFEKDTHNETNVKQVAQLLQEKLSPQTLITFIDSVLLIKNDPKKIFTNNEDALVVIRFGKISLIKNRIFESLLSQENSWSSIIRLFENKFQPNYPELLNEMVLQLIHFNQHNGEMEWQCITNLLNLETLYNPPLKSVFFALENAVALDNLKKGNTTCQLLDNIYSKNSIQRQWHNTSLNPLMQSIDNAVEHIFATANDELARQITDTLKKYISSEEIKKLKVQGNAIKEEAILAKFLYTQWDLKDKHIPIIHKGSHRCSVFFESDDSKKKCSKELNLPSARYESNNFQIINGTMYSTISIPLEQFETLKKQALECDAVAKFLHTQLKSGYQMLPAIIAYQGAYRIVSEKIGNDPTLRALLGVSDSTIFENNDIIDLSIEQFEQLKQSAWNALVEEADKLLKHSIEQGDWQTTQALLERTGSGTPSDKALAEILQKQIHLLPLEVVKVLLPIDSDPTLFITSINSALQSLIDSDIKPKNWEVIEYLCDLPESHRASSEVLSNTLTAAIKDGDAVLACKLYFMKGSSAPDTQSKKDNFSQFLTYILRSEINVRRLFDSLDFMDRDAMDVSLKDFIQRECWAEIKRILMHSPIPLLFNPPLESLIFGFDIQHSKSDWIIWKGLITAIYTRIPEGIDVYMENSNIKTSIHSIHTLMQHILNTSEPTISDDVYNILRDLAPDELKIIKSHSKNTEKGAVSKEGIDTHSSTDENTSTQQHAVETKTAAAQQNTETNTPAQQQTAETKTSAAQQATKTNTPAQQQTAATKTSAAQQATKTNTPAQQQTAATKTSAAQQATKTNTPAQQQTAATKTSAAQQATKTNTPAQQQTAETKTSAAQQATKTNTPAQQQTAETKTPAQQLAGATDQSQIRPIKQSALNTTKEVTNLPKHTVDQGTVAKSSEQNNINESDNYSTYISKLLQTTCSYKNTLSEENKAIHLILDELIDTLNKNPKDKTTIEQFYKILDRDSGNNKTNLEVIKENKERSTALFILGIAVIAATLITGILPGLITMAVVYARTSLTPMSFFKTKSEIFDDALEQIKNDPSTGPK